MATFPSREPRTAARAPGEVAERRAHPLPTPEEIAALDQPRTGGSRRGAIILLLLAGAVLGLLAFLEAVSGRPPSSQLDPMPANLRRGLGRRW